MGTCRTMAVGPWLAADDRPVGGRAGRRRPGCGGAELGGRRHQALRPHRSLGSVCGVSGPAMPAR